MKFYLIPIFSISLLLTGCAPAPLKQSLKENEAVTASLTQNVAQNATWWKHFNDPLLNDFAGQILDQNLNIQIAQSRLKESRALKTQAIAAFFPEIAAAGSAMRSNVNLPRLMSLSQIGLDTSWEIDLFGRTRAKNKAADAKQQSQAAALDDARNVIIADLARAVVEWRQAQQTIREINDLLASQNDQISILESRTQAGLMDASFLERAIAQRAQTATTLPQAQGASNAAQYQIERLLAIRDGSIEKKLKDAKPLTIQVPEAITIVKLSIDNLYNRPDIKKARADLLESEAKLKQTEADLWPSLTLSNFYGAQKGDIPFGTPSNPLWSLAAGVSAPVFNFGKLRSAVNAADERTKQAALSYENTVNEALQETKTALSDYLNGLNTIAAQAQALKSRQSTVAIAKERFDRGLTDMTDLTTTQTELDQATINMITIKTQAAIAYIRLQKALGL
jgi:NodT family efflux transporter outer membrane factor (OMF) lipoprotein